MLYRLLVGSLVVILLMLQYRIWLGDGSLRDRSTIESQIQALSLETEALASHNYVLASEVTAIRAGGQPLEAFARSELGMILPGETLILIIGDHVEP